MSSTDTTPGPAAMCDDTYASLWSEHDAPGVQTWPVAPQPAPIGRNVARAIAVAAQIVWLPALLVAWVVGSLWVVVCRKCVRRVEVTRQPPSRPQRPPQGPARS